MRWLSVALILLAPFAANAAPLGRWLTDGGKAQVEIAPCADKLCGKIVWLAEPLDEQGQPKRDRNNQDEAKRSRPVVGLAMLEGFAAAGEPDKWEGGTIYNPEDGKTYSCTMTLQDADTLRVRGYVGLPLLGKTQVWTRVQ